MRWNRDEPTTNPGHRAPRPPVDSIEYRHGLMMRELAELRERVSALERMFFRASMAPRMKTAGLTTAVAGAVVGALELARYLGLLR